ncbi:MAG TPA: hypothetical protein VGI46_06835 [Candidatus Acidoferrum sp.]
MPKYIAANNHHQPLSPQQKRVICRLRLVEGVPATEIARRFGRGKNVIWRVIREASGQRTPPTNISAPKRSNRGRGRRLTGETVQRALHLRFSEGLSVNAIASKLSSEVNVIAKIFATFEKRDHHASAVQPGPGREHGANVNL